MVSKDVSFFRRGIHILPERWEMGVMDNTLIEMFSFLICLLFCKKQRELIQGPIKYHKSCPNIINLFQSFMKFLIKVLQYFTHKYNFTRLRELKNTPTFSCQWFVITRSPLTRWLFDLQPNKCVSKVAFYLLFFTSSLNIYILRTTSNNLRSRFPTRSCYHSEVKT